MEGKRGRKVLLLDQRGAVTLEASIMLPLILIFFIFIYGLFPVISAQNEMSHALIQSARSLALDSYLTENVESALEAGTHFWGGLSDLVLDLVRLGNNSFYSSQTDWYLSGSGSPEVAKMRFIGFFADGDLAEAQTRLKAMNVVNGMDGVFFETTVEDEVLVLTIKYEIQYWCDIGGIGRIPVEQSIKTRLWK